MAMISTVPFLLILLELVWQTTIKYPPTLEQLHLGVYNPTSLWLVRMGSLALLLAATFFVFRLISKKGRLYFWIFVLASPAFSFIWMCHPLDSLKIFIISASFYLISRFQKIRIATALTCAILLLLNLAIFKENPKILETLSFKRSQEEVTLRFNIEDNLKPHIQIPILVRRIGYNKYFLILKNSVNESLSFFDFETIFFQEVHPMGQKAFVIFFWPEMYLLCLGTWFILIKRRPIKTVVLPLLFLSFIYFITSNTSIERRLFLTLYPLSILLAECVSTVFVINSAKWVKIGTTLLLLLSFYGWITNYYDRFVRPDYWLDNRPIAYNSFLSFLKNSNEKYNQIVVPETLYATKDYCRYYLKDCEIFRIENFDLSKQIADKDMLYVGFIGNFVGPNRENSFPSDLNSELGRTGLEILQKTHILNNIASGYGQELLIVRVKDK
jgi:hypothetical protein